MEKRGNISKEYLNKFYLKQQLLVNDIALFFNCGRSTIYRNLHKFNIPLRGMGPIGRKRLSNLLKTRVRTQESIKKMAQTKRGKNLSSTHKKRIGKGLKRAYKENRRKGFRKGHVPWNKETKGIMKENSGSFKKGHKTWNKGKVGIYLEETIKKIRKARVKQVFPQEDTSIEVKIQTFLKLLGIPFLTHQHMSEIKHSYQCDILIPSMNMVIECDGDYWHKYPIGTKIDRIRTKELLEKGFKVLRLWERDVKKMDIKEFDKKFVTVVGNPVKVWE